MSPGASARPDGPEGPPDGRWTGAAAARTAGGLRWMKTRLGLEGRRARHAAREALLRARLALGRGIRHLHGRTDVPAGPDELVVLCLVRNGEPWLRSWLDHHRNLGAKHAVILDNGSEDRTVPIAAGREDTTVFSTPLPFGAYHVPLKRWLIRRFGRGGWRLYCDVDELFEVPYGNALGLSGFLRYLNAHGYTALAAQMLDMFSDEPLALAMEPGGNGQRLEGEDLKRSYPFYDVAGVRKGRDKYWLRLNRLDTDELRFHRGGIRERVFGLGGSMLTKHPLMRPDGDLRIFPYDDHFVTGARLADVSGLLRHYTFTRALPRQIREYTDPDLRFNIPSSYERYRTVWKERKELRLAAPRSREFESVEAMLDEGFLIASDRYLEYARARGAVASTRPRR